MRISLIAFLLLALSGGLASAHPLAPLIPARDSSIKVAHNEQHPVGQGVIKAVDAQRHTVEISHEAIPELDLPAATTTFGVVIAVSLKTVHPGMQVKFTVEKKSGGHPMIHSIVPTSP